MARSIGCAEYSEAHPIALKLEAKSLIISKLGNTQ